MDCNHQLSMRQVLDLMGHFYFGKPVNYTCQCGAKCELSLKAELKALCWIVALFVLLIAEILLIGALGGINVYLTLLAILIGICFGFAAYGAMICLFYRLNKFEYTAISYHSIVDRNRMNKR